MGKERRLRRKFHLASKEQLVPKHDVGSKYHTSETLPLEVPSDDLFSGLKINFNCLQTNISDDVRSVKSMKSLKSELHIKEAIPKKLKLKLRRERLLSKIDTVNQLKKEHKSRAKRKNLAIIGDVNPLHDALPTLDDLVKSDRKSRQKKNTSTEVSKKSVEKESKRKKKFVQNVSFYKSLMKQALKSNSREKVNQNIRNIVAYESMR